MKPEKNLKKAVNQRFTTIKNLLMDRYGISSDAKFAESVGIHSQVISDWKHNKSSVTIEGVSKLLGKYGEVNLYYLFAEIGDPIFEKSNDNIEQSKRLMYNRDVQPDVQPDASANSKSTLFEDIYQVMEDPARYSSLKDVVDQLVKDKKKLLYDIDVLKARNDALLDAFRAMSGTKDPGKDEGPENAKTQSA